MTNIEFTKAQGYERWEAELNPSIPITVEVNREEAKDFTVYASVDGDTMSYVPLYSTNRLKDLIFQIDVPEGLHVKMVSWSLVTSAKYI